MGSVRSKFADLFIGLPFGSARESAMPKQRKRIGGGLWPLDENRQYISAKPTSKRNRNRGRSA